jgi:hypothetical protein
MTRFAKRYLRCRNAGLCVHCGKAPARSGRVSCTGCRGRRRERSSQIVTPTDIGLVCPVRPPVARRSFVAIVDRREVLHEVLWDGR